ncbi:hypothetical protein ACFO9E_23750 [Streptomyces maoxianensis]|uniref:Lipoprotein n=1 Tax=Streptomyces maoxianensis TaxID=1459942 RepID=A0ABV9GDU8_9ACTN
MNGTKRLRARAGTATVLAVMALSVSACSGAGNSTRAHTPKADSQNASEARVIEGHAYKVDSDPAAAVAFPLNENVFEGTVVSHGPDVHVTDKLEDGATFEAVYTPVVVRVDTVHKGSLKAGSEIVVRSMGGVADGVKYVTEEAPAKGTFAKGHELLVFAGRKEAVESESTPAVTPHFVYLESGSKLVDVTYASGTADGSTASELSKAAFKVKLRSLKASS